MLTVSVRLYAKLYPNTATPMFFVRVRGPKVQNTIVFVLLIISIIICLNIIH